MKKAKPAPKKVGRPPLAFNQAVADKICSILATGVSMRQAIRDNPDLPARSTMQKWLNGNPEFAAQYARACELRADAIVEDIQDIADDGTNDYMEKVNEDGACIGWAVNGENIQRSRLRVDARKWMAAKMAPKKYGEHIEHKHSGSVTLEALVANDPD